MRDYLTGTSSWSTLEQDAARQGFDVNLALLRASVYQVCSMASSTHHWEEWREERRHNIKSALQYARQAEESIGQAQTTLLDTLDKAAGTVMLNYAAADDLLQPFSTGIHWSTAILHEFGEDSCAWCPESFLEFAVMSGLTLYVKSKLKRMDDRSQSTKNHLLFYATVAPDQHKTGSSHQMSTARFLIEYGADPNFIQSDFLQNFET